MATAIEYGLVGAVIAVAGAVTLNAVKPDSKELMSKPAESQNILIPENTKAPDIHSYLFTDRETGCQYVVFGESISPRYSSDGIPICVSPNK